MSMKNPLTPAGIEPATFRFVAQHLNHCATVVPAYMGTYLNICIHIYIYIYIYAGILKLHHASLKIRMFSLGSQDGNSRCSILSWVGIQPCFFTCRYSAGETEKIAFWILQKWEHNNAGYTRNTWHTTFTSPRGISWILRCHQAFKN